MWKGGINDQKIKLRNRAYSILIVTIIILILSSQIVVQYALNQINDDAHLINMAGRQRMLSQKIVKLVCQEDTVYYYELKKALQEWHVAHQGLQEGNADLGLSKLKNDTIRSLFVSINPSELAIYSAVSNIIAGEDFAENSKVIYENELIFLPIMEQIVKAYEIESEEKLQALSRLDFALAFASLLILVIEILYIVQPSLKKVLAQNAALREIAWSQSHEVRRPVTNILGFIELIKDTEMTDEQEELFRYIRESTNDLDKIIRDTVAKANEHE